jgi:hypothetical protein
MSKESFNTENIDFTHVSGLSYSAICHPSGLGVDIIQCDTGQLIQTIELRWVEEVCWSANSSHLAIIIHADPNRKRQAGATTKSASRKHSQASNSATSNDLQKKLKKIDEDRVTETEKYELRVYSCNESSTSVPLEWSIWKTISAPLYSDDYMSTFAYHNMSFSFPLITMSVTLNRIDFYDDGNESSKNNSDCLMMEEHQRGPIQESKVVLLDVNVCLYDEVLLFLPDSDNDNNSSSGTIQFYCQYTSCLIAEVLDSVVEFLWHLAFTVVKC